MKPKIKIDVVADVVCPWCYLGEHRLFKAMEGTRDLYEFEINFKAFELDPNSPQEGKNHRQHLIEKFGSEAGVDDAHDRLEAIGTEEGLVYDFDKLTFTANTFRAHRLIWLAKKYNTEVRVTMALYKAYFSEGQNVNNLEVLIKIGADNDIPKEKLKDFFNSEEGVAEVRQMEQEAAQNGIHSVPAFILNDQYLISGAQMPETLVNAFEQIVSKV